MLGREKAGIEVVGKLAGWTVTYLPELWALAKRGYSGCSTQTQRLESWRGALDEQVLL